MNPTFTSRLRICGAKEHDNSVIPALFSRNVGMVFPGISDITPVMRVLVVEDEKKTAAFIRKAVQSGGFRVDVLHDGAEALAVTAATPFDAIVLDIMLPGRDGLSVLR